MKYFADFRLKVIGGFLAVILFMIVLAFIVVQLCMVHMVKSVGNNSLVMTEIWSNQVNHRVEYLKDFVVLNSALPILQEILRLPNQSFLKTEIVLEPITQESLTGVHPNGVQDKSGNPLPSVSDLEDLLRDEFIEFWHNKLGYQLITEITVLNRYGRIVCQTGVNISSTDADATKQSWLEYETYQLGKLNYSTESVDLTIPLSVKIIDDNGNFLGILRAEISLLGVIIDVGISPYTYETTKIQLIDFENKRLIYSSDAFEIYKDVSKNSVLNQINIDSGFFIAEDKGKSKLFSFYTMEIMNKPETNKCLFLMSHDRDEILASSINLRKKAILISILIVSVTILLSVMVSQTIIGPMQESEQKFNKLFNLNPVGLSVTRMADGKVRAINKSFADYTGYIIGDALGRTSVELGFWPKPEDREIVTQKIKNEGKIRNLEFHYCTKSGEMRFGSFSTDIITLEGEECIITAFLDITERYKIEQKLHKTKEYQEKLFNAITDCVIAVDMDLSIITCNDAVEEIFGYDKDEAIGKNSMMMYPKQQEYENIKSISIEKIKATGTWKGEITVKHKNGKTFPAHLSASLLIDEKGKPVGFVEVFRDLSKEKAAQKELDRQRLALIHSDRLRSLGKLAAGIAHEVNQPLSGVRGLAEQMLLGDDRGWVTSDQERRENLSLIIDQVDRMTHVIDRVRMFGRNSDNKFNVQPVNPNKLVHSVAAMLRGRIQKNGVNLVLELAESLPTVWMNIFSLEEVLINLLTNARDALEERLGKAADFTPQIVVRSMQKPGDENYAVRIEVHDNGAGIAADILPRIFESFFTTKEVSKGVGLGLSISKSIVEEYGGELLVDSIYGKGTTVVLVIPTIC